LILDALKLLEPGGTLIFSNNLRRFRLDREALSAALGTPRGSGPWPARPAVVPSGETGLEIRDITAATLPRDFARNPRIHRVWRIERRSGTAN
jgi:23S rRNA (guanine2445-N2)-methyltransferase / 23S rRNA (guanine2069-N7)-methyltransferase